MATTKYIVNNVTGQTINGESILPAYKVYTALLTQSGGDDIAGQYSGTLIIGRTYEIIDVGDPAGDWTNVGAPNNNEGTYFVATGTTPNSWGDGGGLSYNSGAPVVTVLENTIGNIWFTYGEEGFYAINSDGLFSVDKTFFTSSLGPNGGDYATPALLMLYRNDINTVQLITSNVNGNALNDCMLKTSIEIRVYN
jgi:hypothetical protein